MLIKLLVTFIVAFIYTILRYVVYGGVAPSHIPIFLLNKSVSMASVIFLFYSAYNFSAKNHLNSKFWGKASLHTAYLHIIFSLSILSKAYYAKFFMAEKLNLTGELVLLFGILASYFLFIMFKPNLKLNKIHYCCIVTSIFIALHLVTMGFSSWLAVHKWYGGLPPISLISFLFASLSLIYFFKSPKENLSGSKTKS